MPNDPAVPHRLLIGGAWQTAQGAPLARCDPATEESRPPVIAASPEQVARAVAAAQQSGWQASTPDRRLAALDRLVEAIGARAESFAQAISHEIGAPIDFARRGQVGAALDHLAAMRASFIAAPDDAPVAPDRPGDRVRYEPAGIAALITPWNWPLNQVVLKAGAALLAGCPMVLKPSELGTDTAMLFALCMEDAGLPDGAFNLLTGGAATGAALVADQRVEVISFTGSTRAGQAIAAAAAVGFRRTILEMGGKSPNLLFADCDLPTAIRQGLAHCFRNNGQSCNAAARMLVAREVYDDAVALAAALAADTPVGPPDLSGDHVGPQVSAAQFAHVQGLLGSGLAEGARLVAGGPGRAPGFARGFFTRPSVLADVTPQMRVFREEIFGPVLTMTPFDTEDEAVALANDTPYGLAGYIQTTDPVRADRVARSLRVGMVQVNGQSRVPGAPFGGVKASGTGREAGLWGIRAFQEIKSISGAQIPSLTS
ncbi:aldehyde dehydrogenase family protein [Meridianimarinicoccus roseus]|uniref:aldehyde dehydrogenase (NAD(+)) n=1 Tax=Meridianimarinicoccus roseus TaxID=2072018 RepID=A0A2V2LM79_9RHOB|nr:aldehyde dehydrogenase family protein [Meridianimarinicoccus roseus]